MRKSKLWLWFCKQCLKHTFFGATCRVTACIVYMLYKSLETLWLVILVPVAVALATALEAVDAVRCSFIEPLQACWRYLRDFKHRKYIP